MTTWVYGRVGAEMVRNIMLVHDVQDAASCRVAMMSGYPFLELRFAKPPHWLTDAHIHVAGRGAP